MRWSWLCLRLAVLSCSILMVLVLFVVQWQHTGKMATKSESAISPQQRRLPTALIIGVRKGGTRALLRFLAVHPDVRHAGREVHFFDSDARYTAIGAADWYRAQMPLALSHNVVLEKTPAYFHRSETVPARVRAVLGLGVRLVLLVREPVARTLSDYTQIVSSAANANKPHRSLEQIVTDTLRTDSKYHSLLLDISKYDIHMQRWLRFFPLQQFHFVSATQLVRSPVTVLNDLERFLGLRHFIGPHHFYFNAARGFFCRRLSLVQLRGASSTSTNPGCLSRHKGRKHFPVHNETRQLLKHFFQPHLEAFFRIINRTILLS